MLPHEYFALPVNEQAFIAASVNRRIEAEKERQREAERKANQGRRH